MLKPLTVTEPAQLQAFLFASYPQTKKIKIKQWLKFASVLVNGKVAKRFDRELIAGDVVEVRSETATKALKSSVGALAMESSSHRVSAAKALRNARGGRIRVEVTAAESVEDKKGKAPGRAWARAGSLSTDCSLHRNETQDGWHLRDAGLRVARG